MRVFALLGLGVVFVSAACGGSTASDGSGGSSTGGSATGGSATGGTSAGGSGGSSSGGTGAVGFTACPGPGTCTLFATNCCGGYCDPNAPLSGYQAVNTAKVGALEKQLCTGDIMCPGCVSVENPNNIAVCRAGSCAGVDIRKDQLSACTGDDECRVRWGSNCCEDCGGGNTETLVAYNKNKSLEAEVCDPSSGACPPCAPPPYPSYILPYCGQDGHCTWTLVGP
jgi:hypothetical protein